MISFKPWILSPAVCTCHVHRPCSPTTFTPLGGTSTPSGNTINDIHKNPEAKQLGVKVDIGLILMQNLSKTWTGSEQWHIIHHQCACFLDDLSANNPSTCINISKSTHTHLPLLSLSLASSLLHFPTLQLSHPGMIHSYVVDLVLLYQKAFTLVQWKNSFDRRAISIGPGRLCQNNFKHNRLSILVRIMLE